MMEVYGSMTDSARIMDHAPLLGGACQGGVGPAGWLYTRERVMRCIEDLLLQMRG